MRTATHARGKSEPTIALINIVFLMLIFFMVASTLAPPLDPDLKLIETQSLEGREPPDALIIHADGSLSYRGTPLGDVSAYLSGLGDAPVARLVPVRAAPAAKLVEVARSLRIAGADKVVIVTRQALE